MKLDCVVTVLITRSFSNILLDHYSPNVETINLPALDVSLLVVWHDRLPHGLKCSDRRHSAPISHHATEKPQSDSIKVTRLLCGFGITDAMIKLVTLVQNSP